MPPCHGGDQGFKSPRGRTCNIKTGDEVIVPAYTWGAAAVQQTESKPLLHLYVFDASFPKRRARFLKAARLIEINS